jgi:hypothetical protein
MRSLSVSPAKRKNLSKEKNCMKRMIASTLALLVLAVIVPTAHAAPEAEPCTAAMLKGNYGFTFSGFFQNQGANLPISGVGIGIFDGQGNASATVIASFNGAPSIFPWTGAYSVNPDCTGSLTATPGKGLISFSIVVVRGGAEILGEASDPGNTWTIDLKKAD